MYICCHRAGKAKDLYSRSFLLDEKTLRRDERVARERQNEERGKERETERQRGVVSGELGEDCHESGKRKERTTGTKRGKGGRRTSWKMDGGGRSAALGERAG